MQTPTETGKSLSENRWTGRPCEWRRLHARCRRRPAGFGASSPRGPGASGTLCPDLSGISAQQCSSGDSSLPDGSTAAREVSPPCWPRRPLLLLLPRPHATLPQPLRNLRRSTSPPNRCLYTMTHARRQDSAPMGGSSPCIPGARKLPNCRAFHEALAVGAWHRQRPSRRFSPATGSHWETPSAVRRAATLAGTLRERLRRSRRFPSATLRWMICPATPCRLCRHQDQVPPCVAGGNRRRRPRRHVVVNGFLLSPRLASATMKPERACT